MSVNLSTEIVGIRDTVQELKKTKPAIYKEFRSKANFAVKPIVKEAKARLAVVSARNGKNAPLSGFTRTWAPKGRQIFPWNQKKATSGIKMLLRTNKSSFLAVTQADAAGAIFDIAGKKTRNPMGVALSGFNTPSRIMWPSAEDKQDEVKKNLAESVDFVNDKTNKKLR